MERVSGYFGVGWHYDGSTLSVSRFETRVFTVEALPGSGQIQEGMQDDANSSSSGGGSGGSGGAGGGQQQNTITQNSKFNIDLKYWDELGQVLTSMLGGTGTAVVSPSLGIITVSTTPEIMHAVADYLSSENKRLSRQIAINIEVYSVNLSDGQDFNVSFNAALNRLANFGGFTYTSAGAPSSAGSLSGLGSLSLAILNPSNNNFVHAGDVFNALSSIGDTTRVAQFPMTTLNNRPVSRRVGRDIAYVQSSTTSNTAVGSTSNIGTAVQPATIHEGFSVQVTPRLLDDGRILMQYSLSLIDLEKITSFNSVCGASSDTTSCSGGAGSTTVELPQTTNRIFVQQSVLRSGSMLVIGGVDEEDLGQNAQGVGNPFNFLLGGGSSNAKAHTMVFIAVTPQVIDVPQAEHG
jgi:type IVB pilus formation R64 PilN family outer membrane protein